MKVCLNFCVQTSPYYPDMELLKTMTFKPGVRRDPNRVRTSGAGGRGIAIGGGGIGALLLAGILWYFGADPQQIQAALGGGEQTAASPAEAYTLDHCDVSDTANQHADCRIVYTSYSLDEIWSEILPQQAGIEYVKPGVVVFKDSVQSGCGRASAATGPFYCPADQSSYYDVTFFDQLKNFGAENTPFAQQYIVAHEFGHHIQQLQGTLHLANYNEPGADSNAVKIELQADCYAGIWAYHADKREGSATGDSVSLEPVSKAELASAINAARGVGDDNIQRRSGGEVRPDMFTHGSSEQRQAAFLSGYKTGQMSSCKL